jgi:Tol biopolymer transport system component
MRLLVCLMASRGEPVSRASLLDQVWGETFVGEGSLTLAISELRRILGDDPRSPRYIETIRKVGYRWLPAVTVDPGRERAEPPPPPVGEDRGGGIPSARARRLLFPSRLTVALGGLCIGLAVATGWFLAAPQRGPEGAPAHRTLPVPVTAEPGMEVGPSLSPDGRQLAYAQWDLPEVHFRILLRHRDTATAVPLTRGAASDDSPTWSPEGDRLAFTRCSAEGCGIFVQTIPGDDPRRVSPLGIPSPAALSWSPDGRSLVFADRPRPGERFRLFQVDLERGSPVALEVGGAEGDALYPRLSPDGRRLVFARGDLLGGTEKGLFGVSGHLVSVAIESPGGSAVRRLTPTPEEIFGLAWSPTGEALVYAVRTPGQRWELRRLEAATGAVSTLWRGEMMLRNPVVSPRGEVIVEAWQGDRNIWRVDLATGEGERWLESTRQDAEPALSPDGSRVAFISSRSGAPELWLVERASGALHPLTDFDGPPVATPRWSPGGARLAFGVKGNGTSAIYLLDTDPPGEPRRLLEWPGAAGLSGWSRDGRHLYVGSDREGRWQLWRVAVEDGRAEKILEDGIAAAELGEAPGGGLRLLYMRPAQCGLWEGLWKDGRLRPQGQVSAAVEWSDQANWGIVAAGVYYLERDPVTQEVTVRLWDPDTGEDIPLATLPWLSSSSTGVSLSQDASELLYTRLEGLNADLVAIPF